MLIYSHMAMEQMRQLQKFLHAISDEKRIRILKMLERKPTCICQMTAVLGIRQPTVSKHIKKLKEANLVYERRNGNFRLFILNHNHQYINIWWVVSSFVARDEIDRDYEKLQKTINKIPIKINSQMAINFSKNEK